MAPRLITSTPGLRMISVPEKPTTRLAIRRGPNRSLKTGTAIKATNKGVVKLSAVISESGIIPRATK